MSRLPPATGLIAPAGGGAVGTSPGREICRVDERRLPDGRVVRFVHRVQTYSTPDHTYITVDVTEGPTLQCGCGATRMEDIFVCAASGAIVCGRHAGCCSLCGRVFSAPMLIGTRLGGVRAVICRACAAAMRPTFFQRCLATFERLLRG